MTDIYDVEELLVRELRQVADDVRVPPLPALPEDPPQGGTWSVRWLPLLAAAAVLLVVLGAVAVVTALGDRQRISPAPEPGRGSEISTAAPTLPVVLGTDLYVDGEQVPGQWGWARGLPNGWVGVRQDGTYVSGRPDSVNPIDYGGEIVQPPAVSPSGDYVAFVYDQGGQTTLTGFDTFFAGEGLGGLPVPPVTDQGVPTAVAAVTDDGLVVTSGGLVWRPLLDNSTVPLPDGTVVWRQTEAGLVVLEGTSDPTQGTVYLAELAEDGTLTEIADLPHHDELEASEEWLAWVDAGTLGGETSTYDELRYSRPDGSGSGVLTAPEGFVFKSFTLRWETAEELVVVGTGPAGDRAIRCAPALGECVLLDTP